MGLFVEKTLTNSHQPDTALISEHDTKYFLEAKYFLETEYFLGLSSAAIKGNTIYAILNLNCFLGVV